MKQQILTRYTELCEKFHFNFFPQLKAYLETEKEIDKDMGIEEVNLPYPGNSTYNFNTSITDKNMQPINSIYE